MQFIKISAHFVAFKRLKKHLPVLNNLKPESSKLLSHGFFDPSPLFDWLLNFILLESPHLKKFLVSILDET